jgi:uncharacterized protein (TIGR00725 family)
MKLKIGVIGSAVGFKKEIIQKAREIGKEIAKRDCILVNGATKGLPFEAALGAKEYDGLVMGFSPASNIAEHIGVYGFPTENLDIIIYTGFGLKGRNVLFIRSCDGVIAIGGRIGTLNEFTIAFDEKKTIALLKGSGGVCDNILDFVKSSGKKGGEIVSNTNPEKLVEKLLEKL